MVKQIQSAAPEKEGSCISWLGQPVMKVTQGCCSALSLVLGDKEEGGCSLRKHWFLKLQSLILFM